MRVRDLHGKNVFIWGTKREGLAAAALVHKANPDVPLVLGEDATEGPTTLPNLPSPHRVVRGPALAAALDQADVVIKSPGVSLYQPLLDSFRARGGVITSVLNLWLAEPRTAQVVGITGTKGKSTTSALLAHTLAGLGVEAAALGNIGVPLSEEATHGKQVVIAEVSSYQAALIEDPVPVGALTSLYPCHLDWHRSLGGYYRDKMNLLAHSRVKVVNALARPTLAEHGLVPEGATWFNAPEGIHVREGLLWDADRRLGTLENRHLAKPHNLANIAGILTILKVLGHDPVRALPEMESYQGLPHRQFELGERDGMLWVDDSIASTPPATLAALEAYRGRPLTLIVGGIDVGISPAPLVDYVARTGIPETVICLGTSYGRVLEHALRDSNTPPRTLLAASDMHKAVALAHQHTPAGGAVLLSPGAASFDLFTNFVERGHAFAREAGFALSPAR